MNNNSNGHGNFSGHNTNNKNNLNYGSNLGAHSSLISDQVYNKNGRTGGQNAYSSNSNAYSKNQNWDKSQIYQDAQGVAVDTSKYKYFNDLKILNEIMIDYSNNMQPDNSPLQMLSQGQESDIRLMLMGRLKKTSFISSFLLFLISIVAIFSNLSIISILSFIFYISIVGGTLFYPAKLFYENVQYKTNKTAELYYDEMDYWFKIGVVNFIGSIIFMTIVLLVVSFFEDKLLLIISELVLNNTMDESFRSSLEIYISKMGFTGEFIFFSVLNIAIIFTYFKFINRQKTNAEIMRVKRIIKIRNQTMSRVEQVQDDKNEIN